ncbi:MAG: sensor histidine kinase [Deltaproteobacteria bacterium]|nr:MAG: sensor histidine kinase [Deltaproteobacteria bacterium]
MDAAAAQTLVHDLNNVLPAISTHAESICDDVPATSDAQASARAILDAARIAATSCGRACRAAARPRTAVEPADLVSAARSVHELLRPRTPDRVGLVFEPGIPTAPVLADRVQLERLLIDLTTNAIDAVAARGGPGRVLVSIDDAPPWPPHGSTDRP